MAQLTTFIALPYPVLGTTSTFLVFSLRIGSNLILILLSINFCKHFAEAARSCAQPRLICKDVLTISQVQLDVRFHLFPGRNSNYFQLGLLSNGCCNPEIINLFIKFVTLIRMLKSLCYCAYTNWKESTFCHQD